MRGTPYQIDDLTREAASEWCLLVSKGPLPPEQRQAFNAWLTADEEHPALFERTVAAWNAVEEQGATAELLQMREAAIASVRRANKRRWSVSFGRARALAIAACLAFLIGGTGLLFAYLPTTYETGVSERRVVALPDGSVVSLDASTRIQVRYWWGRRQLWLERGRAKFSVSKDPLRPFSVQSGDNLVVATGTQFSVERLSHELRVILYEGRVELLHLEPGTGATQSVRIGRNRYPAEQVLAPGKEVVIAASAPTARLVAVDIGRSSAWESGLLEFSDEPLGVAVERMNRYRTAQLRVARPSDALIPISGQFTGGDVDAFVEGVTAVFPVRVRREPDGSVTLLSTETQKTAP